MKKTLTNFFILLLPFVYTLQAQQTSLPMNNRMVRIYEKHLHQSGEIHTAFKPYKAGAVYQAVFPDSLYGLKRIEDAEKGFKRFMNVVAYEDLLAFTEDGLVRHFEYDSIYAALVVKKGKTKIKQNPSKFYITANPLLRIEMGYDLPSSNLLSLYRSLGYNRNGDFISQQPVSYNMRGLELRADIGSKLTIYTSFLEHQARYPGYIIGNFDVNEKGVVPGEGKTRPFKARGFDYSGITAYLAFEANKYFSGEVGHGKHFIGDGYRSLFLSDNAFVYPYLRLTTSFWKIKYTNIVTEFQNVTNSGRSDLIGFPRKLGSFIYVSADLAKWFQMGLFEGIIWDRTGPNGNTKFDYNFINPVFGVRGFQKKLDANKVYGVNMKFVAPHNFIFYGQFMINQLGGLSTIENRTGYQAGVKYLDAFGVRNLNFQLEYNRVRPYSYASSDSSKHYSHYSQSLAHPLGANFSEFMGSVDYRWKRFYAGIKATAVSQGLDVLLDDVNVGSNIFEPLFTADITNGVKVGQGDKYRLFHNEVSVGYIINPKINLCIEAKLVNRLMSYQKESYTNHVVFLSLSTQLFNHYYDVGFNY